MSEVFTEGSVSIKVHSCRTTNMARPGSIAEVSYSIFDTNAGEVGFRTAMRLPLEDVDGDGFIDVPTKLEVAKMVFDTLSDPSKEQGKGAGGFPTALATLCDQLKNEHNAPQDEVEELSDFMPEDGLDNDDD